MSASSTVEGVVAADLPSEGIVTFRHDKGYTDVPLSLPDGIAIQLIAGRPIATNTDGRTLYTLEGDIPASEAGKWRPALATAGVQERADWSLVPAPQGGQQWSYKGKPLYVFVEDARPGEAKGDSQLTMAVAAASRRGSVRQLPPTGAKAAVLGASADMAVPAGIQLREVFDVAGIGLADANGKTIYYKEGEAKAYECRANCPWLALRAPPGANAVGEFSALAQPNGFQQWAYQGKLLYTFVGDDLPGDARGAGLQGEWRVALLERHYFPPGAEIRNVLGTGTILTVDGKTLYQRDRYYGQFGGRTLRRGFPITAESGRSVGARGCDAACERQWLPFIAPEGAKAGGHWSVLERTDGKKQWCYKGFALYTYVEDERPGEVNGNALVDIYDLSSPKPGPYAALLKEAYVIEAIPFKSPMPPNLTSALHWHVVYP